MLFSSGLFTIHKLQREEEAPWKWAGKREARGRFVPGQRMAAVSLFDRAMTRPVFEADAAHLAEELKSCPAWRLEPRWGVNPELAVQAFCAIRS